MRPFVGPLLATHSGLDRSHVCELLNGNRADQARPRMLMQPGRGRRPVIVESRSACKSALRAASADERSHLVCWLLPLPAPRVPFQRSTLVEPLGDFFLRVQRIQNATKSRGASAKRGV